MSISDKPPYDCIAWDRRGGDPELAIPAVIGDGSQLPSGCALHVSVFPSDRYGWRRKGDGNMMKLWKWIGAALTIGLAPLVQAQDWPTKPNMERPFDER